MKSARALLQIGCIAAMLAGCGFHLRESPMLHAQVESIHVAAVKPYGALARGLRRELELLGVAIAEDPAVAQLRLTISDERNTRRALTTTSLITVAEYELQLEVEFALDEEGQDPLIPPTWLTTRRVYVLDQTSLAGSSEEEELLKAEMQEELIGAILRRVDAVTRERAGVTPGDAAVPASTGDAP